MPSFPSGSGAPCSDRWIEFRYPCCTSSRDVLSSREFVRVAFKAHCLHTSARHLASFASRSVGTMMISFSSFLTFDDSRQATNVCHAFFLCAHLGFSLAELL